MLKIVLINNPDIKVYLSICKNSRYAMDGPVNKEMIIFENIICEDYTKHLSETRCKNYVFRASHIKGYWKHSPYLTNKLAIDFYGDAG
jgi:hypothetical protein